MLKRLLYVLAGLASASGAFAQDKIKVLMLDGQNNHNWKMTTKATRATLLQTGRFDVDVATSPADKGDKAAWDAWTPDFAAYDVVFSNYNDGGRCIWSEEMKAAFQKFVTDGGGLVVVHAADNSCGDWPAYNEMIAVGGWGGRKPASGSHLRFKDGKWTTDAAPNGGSGSHGPQHEFVVEHDIPDHPILQGLPEKWMHGKDELYDSLRGPCKNVKVLASAYSAKTKRREPMMMTIQYGKGRVFHTPMGHVGGMDPVFCIGFQTVVARGTEWAATGAVSIPMPEAFPTPEKSSMIPPNQVVWETKDETQAGGWIPLFNGRDLEGWTPKIRGHQLGENFANTFRVEDGLLKVGYDGYEQFDSRFGHLFYETPYSHYLFRVEYRFTGEQVPGGPGWAWRNSGVMVHGQDPKTMGVDQEFPVSIEVQLLGGNGEGKRPTANLCTPGTHVEMNEKLLKRHCTNSESETYHGDQWVTVEIEVLGNDSITHLIDEKSVLAYRRPQLDPNDGDSKSLVEARGGDVMLTGGSISLQSESHPVEFRRVEILPLDGNAASH